MLPVLKPKSSSIDGKKQDGRGKAESAGTSGIAAGSKQKPSLASKSKTPEIGARKRDAKGKVETVGASASATAAGLHKSSLRSKSKTSENRCDMIVATAVLPHDRPAAIEPGVMEFLGSTPVLHWAEVALGL